MTLTAAEIEDARAKAVAELDDDILAAAHAMFDQLVKSGLPRTVMDSMAVHISGALCALRQRTLTRLDALAARHAVLH
jgi:hypothetical protein